MSCTDCGSVVLGGEGYWKNGQGRPICVPCFWRALADQDAARGAAAARVLRANEIEDRVGRAPMPIAAQPS